MICIFCHFILLKPFTLRVDHAILLDVLTSLPVSIQYYIVPCALQRPAWQSMQNVVILTRVDMQLGQSEDVYL